MNKFVIIIAISVFLFSCIGQYNSDAQKAVITEPTIKPISQSGDTVQIDISQSNIHWKGTKMRGAGKHEGEIELKSGYLITENGQLSGGNFIVDMSTLSVTDIPTHEPIPRKNLTDHLKSADFFDVDQFPTAEFQIADVTKLTTDSLKISGNLTIKSISKYIAFGVKYQDGTFSTKFTFDRFQWNIAYTGNWADKTLVDRDIELKMELKKK